MNHDHVLLRCACGKPSTYVVWAKKDTDFVHHRCRDCAMDEQARGWVIQKVLEEDGP